MYAVEFSKQARKTLKSMPANTAKRVIEKIEQLAVNPFAPNQNIKALIGRPHYRLRVGDWRVIYAVHDNVLIVEVLIISPRGSAYQ
jgi:mRNA interferase RelE/StbE